ncbi:MAG TPA: hypothetical protein VJS89_10195 [Gammaproteobacteria bacterium]|nr:hypothetical protein [Gammaproteobacteria bacterium]
MTAAVDTPLHDERVAFARKLWDFCADPMQLIEILGPKPGKTPDFDEWVDQSLEAAVNSTDTNDYDVLVVLAAGYLRDPVERQMMPIWLSRWTADVLEGKRTRPAKRGPDRYRNFFRNWRLHFVTEETAHRFNLPLYAQGAALNEQTAAEIVAQATGISHATIVKILQRRI